MTLCINNDRYPPKWALLMPKMAVVIFQNDRYFYQNDRYLNKVKNDHFDQNDRYKGEIRPKAKYILNDKTVHFHRSSTLSLPDRQD